MPAENPSPPGSPPVPDQPSRADSAGFALAPLALAPPLLAAALLHPSGLDPVEPLASAPLLFWALLFLGALAPAATVVAARRSVPDRDVRVRILLEGGAGALAGLAATAVALIALGDATLVRSGAAWFLVMAAVIAVAVVAGAVAQSPRSYFRWGLLVGEMILALVTRAIFAAPQAPDEFLRHVMVVAPGWGETNMAALAARALRRRIDHTGYGETLRRLDAALVENMEQGAFAPPYSRWGDDARVVRALLQKGISWDPELPEETRIEALRTAADELLLFAESPAASLEPFTAGGVLGTVVLEPTAGLDVPRDLRFRIALAWNALEILAFELDEPEREQRPQALVRKLFEENGLDRSHPIHLMTYAITRRRLVEAGDAQGLLRFYGKLESEEWPEGVRSAFAKQSGFIRAHPEEDYRPVMWLLLARSTADRDPDAARALYAELLATWPDSPLSAQARLELSGLPPQSRRGPGSPRGSAKRGRGPGSPRGSAKRGPTPDPPR